MHSKYYPWDMPKILKEVKNSQSNVYAFSFYDPFIENLVLNPIKNEQGPFRLVWGSTVNKDWIQENLGTLDLFGQTDGFLIKAAQEMSKDACEALLEMSAGDITHKIIFSFSGTNKFFQKWVKNDWVFATTLMAPRFWEAPKYLDFLCESRGIEISYNIKSTILNMTELLTSQLMHVLDLVELHFLNNGQKNIDPRQLQKLYSGNKLDNFELATCFSTRKLTNFYKQILADNCDFDSLRSIFNFMQSHIFKIMDTSYMANKARLSKYDKEIESASRIWKVTELDLYLKLFGRLEIEAKKRSPELRGQLRQLYLKQLN